MTCLNPGLVSMTAWSFAKVAYREDDVYTSIVNATMAGRPEELRTMGVCNLVWALATVGYRSDPLLDHLCNLHLSSAEGAARFAARKKRRRQTGWI